MAFRVFQKLHDLFREEARDRTLVEIPLDHVDDAGAPEPVLRGGEGYFRIWITHMFLAERRDWFETRAPSVNTFTSFNFGGLQSPVEIACAAGPKHLGSVDKSHLDTVISVNHLVCPTVPFRGGSVEFEAALLSVELRDDMDRFLNAMGTVASLVAVPQLSGALAVAEKVASGVRDLAGVDGNRMVLGYQNTFVGDDDTAGDPSHNELRGREVAVINAPSDNAHFTSSRLWLVDGQVLVGDARETALALTGVDWMTIRIQTMAVRDDYESLADIMGPLVKAINALGGDVTHADSLARQAIMAAHTSDDLVDSDRTRVAAKVAARYQEAKKAVLGEGLLSTAPAERLVGVVAGELRASPDGESASDVPLRELLRV